MVYFYFTYGDGFNIPTKQFTIGFDLPYIGMSFNTSLNSPVTYNQNTNLWLYSSQLPSNIYQQITNGSIAILQFNGLNSGTLRVSINKTTTPVPTVTLVQEAEIQPLPTIETKSNFINTIIFNNTSQSNIPQIGLTPQDSPSATFTPTSIGQLAAIQIQNGIRNTPTQYFLVQITSSDNTVNINPTSSHTTSSNGYYPFSNGIPPMPRFPQPSVLSSSISDSIFIANITTNIISQQTDNNGFSMKLLYNNTVIATSAPAIISPPGGYQGSYTLPINMIFTKAQLSNLSVANVPYPDSTRQAYPYITSQNMAQITYNYYPINSVKNNILSIPANITHPVVYDLSSLNITLNAYTKYTLSLVPLGTPINSFGYTGSGNLTCSNANNGNPPYTFYGVIIQYANPGPPPRPPPSQIPLTSIASTSNGNGQWILNASTTITSSQFITIPLNNLLIIPAGMTLTVSGNIVNNYLIIINGAVVFNYGSNFTNTTNASGIVTNNNGASITFNGKVINNGYISCKGGNNSFITNSGNITNNNGSAINNYYTFTNQNGAIITINNGATLINGGTFTNNGTIINNGGTVNNTGTIAPNPITSAV
jgi:hypothetical protein